MEIIIKLEPRETEVLINALCGSNWGKCPAVTHNETETHSVMGGVMNFKDLPEDIQEAFKNIGNLGLVSLLVFFQDQYPRIKNRKGE